MTMMRILSRGYLWSALAEEKGQSAAGLLHTDTFQWGLFPGSQLSFVLKIFNHYTTF